MHEQYKTGDKAPYKGYWECLETQETMWREKGDVFEPYYKYCGKDERGLDMYDPNPCRAHYIYTGNQKKCP